MKTAELLCVHFSLFDLFITWNLTKDMANFRVWKAGYEFLLSYTQREKFFFVIFSDAWRCTYECTKACIKISIRAYIDMRMKRYETIKNIGKRLKYYSIRNLKLFLFFTNLWFILRPLFKAFFYHQALSLNFLLLF